MPERAATTDRPSIATPATLPRSTRQASSACRPMVSASLFMTQPPAKTSAVRASTYVPVTEGAGVDVLSAASAGAAARIVARARAARNM